MRGETANNGSIGGDAQPVDGLSTKVDALVTGATGFIGRNLVRALIKAGKRVRVFVRPGRSCEMLSDLPLEFAHGSLEDAASVRRAVNGAKYIFNCAGLSSDWAPKTHFNNANVNGIRNLLEAMETAGTERLVHLSTSDVYGYPKQACDETREISDIGLPYNRSKVQGERIVWEHVNAKHLPVTVFRPATVYGPGAKDWVIEVGKLMLRKQMLLLDGGRSPAGLIYIDNLVRALMAAAETPAAAGRVYNIRDVGVHSWREYVNTLGAAFTGRAWGCISLPSSVALALAKPMELVYGAMRVASRPLLTRHAVYILSRDQCFGIDRARREIDFDSHVSFAEGMERTCAWLNSISGQKALT